MRKFGAGAGQHGFGLGAEGCQFPNLMRHQPLFSVPPTHRIVEARLGMAGMAQLVVSHRKEEQIHRVDSASARR